MEETFHDDQKLLQTWIAELSKVYIDKEDILITVIASILADGHILIEDLPGSGKTLLAKAIAHSIALPDEHLSMIKNFRRIQGTPDLMPSDILGFSIYNPKEADFSFQPGPVFAHILLADELNRTTPRVQSALLECMAEKQISIESRTYQLDPLFLVLATQNPIDHEGVFPLPAAQLDRFHICLSPGFVEEKQELLLLQSREQYNANNVNPVISRDQLLQLRWKAQQQVLPNPLYQSIVTILRASRSQASDTMGLSTRAGQHFVSLLQAWMFLHGETTVLPHDFSRLARLCFLHRLDSQEAKGHLEKVIANETEALIQRAQKQWKGK